MNRFGEGLEKFAIGAIAAVFRVPLNGDHEVFAWKFQGFDNLACLGRNDQTFTKALDALMMTGVDCVGAGLKNAR